MKIETFYTGGGIWLTEVVINDNGDYAVISNEYPEILSVYHAAENEDEKYMPEDMYISEHYSKLDSDLQELYEKMLKDLNANGE